MLMLDRMRPQNGCDITHVRNIERVLQHTLESVIQRKQLFMQSTRIKRIPLAEEVPNVRALRSGAAASSSSSSSAAAMLVSEEEEDDY